MRKSIITTIVLCGLASGAMAAQEYQGPCQYTTLQNMIRDARSHEQIFNMIRAGVSMDDDTITCGGSLLQLAILRGNPSIVNGILTQDKSRVDNEVSLSGFSIPEAPEKIPIILFAAYYAPSEIVFKVLTDMGADIEIRDSLGHGILWYLNQNPVLRQTKTEDSIKEKLQNMILENARKNSQRQMGGAAPIVLNKIPDNTPKQLATPSLSGSTLATPVNPTPQPAHTP